MKSSIILWIITFQVNAATYAQRINLHVKDAQLDDVLTDLSLQSGFNFIFNTVMIKSARSVNVSVSQATLKEALDACFKDQPLSYLMNVNTVVIKQKSRLVTVVPVMTGKLALSIIRAGSKKNGK